MAGGKSSSKMIGKYEVIRKVGQGSFATVFEAVHTVSKERVAIKKIATRNLNRKLQENLESEIGILKSCDHPNVVRLHDILKSENHMYIVLEFCAGGDLSAYLKSKGRRSEAEARAFLMQLAEGLRFMHDKQVIHRDLKPQNLLLCPDPSGGVPMLKIADFGFARYVQEGNMMETLCGSPLYMAPEVLQYKQYDDKVDLWAVGAILFELLTNRPPFPARSQKELVEKIRRNDIRFPTGVSAECTDLLKGLLCADPTSRIDYDKFFASPFLVASAPVNPSISGGQLATPSRTRESREPVGELAGHGAQPQSSAHSATSGHQPQPASQVAQPGPSQPPQQQALQRGPVAGHVPPSSGEAWQASDAATPSDDGIYVHENAQQRSVAAGDRYDTHAQPQREASGEASVTPRMGDERHGVGLGDGDNGMHRSINVEAPRTSPHPPPVTPQSQAYQPGHHHEQQHQQQHQQQQQQQQHHTLQQHHHQYLQQHHIHPHSPQAQQNQTQQSLSAFPHHQQLVQYSSNQQGSAHLYTHQGSPGSPSGGSVVGARRPIFFLTDLFVGAHQRDLDDLRRALPSVETNIRYALLLFEVADMKMRGSVSQGGDKDGHQEAFMGLVVHMKALDQLNNAVVRAHSVVSKSPAPVAYAPDLLAWLQARLEEGLAKAESAVARMPSDSDPTCPCAEAIVYKYAMAIAREAAVDELLGNVQLSHQRFDVALALLGFVSGTCVDEGDRASLSTYMTSFKHRQDEISARMSRQQLAMGQIT